MTPPRAGRRKVLWPVTFACVAHTSLSWPAWVPTASGWFNGGDTECRAGPSERAGCLSYRAGPSGGETPFSTGSDLSAIVTQTAWQRHGVVFTNLLEQSVDGHGVRGTPQKLVATASPIAEDTPSRSNTSVSRRTTSASGGSSGAASSCSQAERRRFFHQGVMPINVRLAHRV